MSLNQRAALFAVGVLLGGTAGIVLLVLLIARFGGYAFLGLLLVFGYGLLFDMVYYQRKRYLHKSVNSVKAKFSDSAGVDP